MDCPDRLPQNNRAALASAVLYMNFMAFFSLKFYICYPLHYLRLNPLDDAPPAEEEEDEDPELGEE